MGFEIEEFPRILARPPVDPSTFSYGDIRNRIIARGEDNNGIVRYVTMRTFVANMKFIQKTNYINVGGSLNRKFMEISNRRASFESMSKDEKLAEIENLLEYLLKQNGKFIKPDYEEVCDDFVA